MAKPAQEECPCGSGRRFSECCGPYLAGAPAPTAEVLMRSRYTAYVRRDGAYVLATWHPSTRPASLDISTPDQPQWIGLEVKRHIPEDETHARVEFVARYRVNGKAHKLVEVSEFVREQGKWLYLGAYA